MFKLYFIYLLLAHVLGDYYFQNERLAEEKINSLYKQGIHGSIYTVTGIVCILPVFQIKLLIAVLVLSISHFLIDLAKFYYMTLMDKAPLPPQVQRSLYLADQALHIVCIFAASFFLTISGVELEPLPIIWKFFEVIEVWPFAVLSWVTMLLLMWKPANITIKQLLCLYKPSEENSCFLEVPSETEQDRKEVEESSKKIGGFIGFLERLILLILLSINQYSAMGLVLTAKSIARYNKIIENKEFAEYYLLGTLLSTVMVIGAYLIIF
ncbi:DUF3307 domain-containing protein [Anoxybacterium hadale]|uniref:DUF3307 domain-containing protein n=1 Tax=Anoxybacterium hadale TaxID=3408580 RepID=UPI003B0044E2